MVIEAIQEQARNAGLDKMTKGQINAEIGAARREKRTAKARKPANRRGK